MAWRLGAYVTAGVVSNRNLNRIEGWFDLSDGRRLELELRGKVDGELHGKQIQFRVPSASARYFEPHQLDDLRLLSMTQVGVLRQMAYEVRGVMSDLDRASLPRNGRERSDAVERKACLCLEWFSEDGRVVVEIVEPTILEIDGQRPEGVLQPRPLRVSEGVPLEPEDCAGLASQRPDPSTHDSLLDSKTRRLYAEWDEVHSNDRDVPVASRIGDLAAWPDPADVSNAAEAERLVDDMLDRLAMLNIQFDICEHYSSVAAYRLLREEFIPYGVVNPNLTQSKIVAHYDTFDYCPQCRSELGLGTGDDEEADEDDDLSDDDLSDDDLSDGDLAEEDVDDEHQDDKHEDDEQLGAFTQ